MLSVRGIRSEKDRKDGTDIAITNFHFLRFPQPVNVVPDHRDLWDIEETWTRALSLITTFDRVENDWEVFVWPTFPLMERSGDRDGSAGLKFVGVELFVGSSQNGGMVSIVLDEFGVGNSAISEGLVVVLRVRHESFEERGFETECRSDR